MVIELDVMKIFTRSTTNADARSVCGRPIVNLLVWIAVAFIYWSLRFL